MDLNKEQLSEITSLAELQFSIDEVSQIMDISYLKESWPNDKIVKEAYDRGALLAVAELRKSIYKMAKNGSAPAQKQYIEIIKNRERKMRRL